MPRPPKPRNVNGHPAVAVFKPAGMRKCDLREVVLTLDEFEAVRLADFEGLYQDDAAASMGVSRQTFGNIIVEAHRKISDCLVNGKALRIEGGLVTINGKIFECGGCSRRWPEPRGTGKPEACPACGSNEIVHAPDDPGQGRGGGCGRGRRQFRGECS